MMTMTCSQSCWDAEPCAGYLPPIVMICEGSNDYYCGRTFGVYGGQMGRCEKMSLTMRCCGCGNFIAMIRNLGRPRRQDLGGRPGRPARQDETCPSTDQHTAWMRRPAASVLLPAASTAEASAQNVGHLPLSLPPGPRPRRSPGPTSESTDQCTPPTSESLAAFFHMQTFYSEGQVLSSPVSRKFLWPLQEGGHAVTRRPQIAKHPSRPFISKVSD